jgi:hypothetical protein
MHNPKGIWQSHEKRKEVEKNGIECQNKQNWLTLMKKLTCNKKLSNNTLNDQMSCPNRPRCRINTRNQFKNLEKNQIVEVKGKREI